MSYYYDDRDIAATLKRAIAQGASYDEVDRLLKARNRKIDAGGEALAQYKNDALTQEAESYLSSKLKHPTLDPEEFKSAREQVAVENLKAAEQQHRRNYDTGIRALDAQEKDKEKALHAAYRQSALADEELLAASGLGKGASKPSSGYAESTRMGTFLEYQNALAAAKKQVGDQKAQLYASYMDAMDDSRRTYNNQRDAIEADAADMAVAQHNADRNYLLSESAQNRAANQWNQSFDAERSDYADARADALRDYTDARADRALEQAQDKQKTEFDAALQAFKQSGEITSQAMADILGLPLGTKTLERMEFESDTAYRDKVYDREDAWHDDEIAYKNASLQKRSSSSGSNYGFKNAFDLFKTVGEIVTQDMANALGLPIGTKYWQYEQSMQDNVRQQQKVDFETGNYKPGRPVN